MNRGSNGALIEFIAGRAIARIGGGIRTPERAREMLARGAYRVIVGTAAFTKTGVNHDVLRHMPAERLVIALDSRNGRITVAGWQESIQVAAEDVVRELSRTVWGSCVLMSIKKG